MNKINKEIDSLFPRDQTVVFMHAHADDESFLSAGLMQCLAEAGNNVVLIYAATALVKNQPKTIIRKNEVEAACAVLSCHKIFCLKYCEPKYFEDDAMRLIEQEPDSVCEELKHVLNKAGVLGPVTLISYDKNGGYGNSDHKIVHKTGRLFRDKYPELILDLFEITINRDVVNKWLRNAMFRLPENSIPKLSYWSSDFGLEDAEITDFYELSNQQIEKKREALQLHKSQIKPDEFPLSLNEEDFKAIFGREYLLKVE